MIIEIIVWFLTTVSISVLVLGLLFHERASKTRDAEEYVITFSKRTKYLGTAFFLGISVAVSSVMLPHRSFEQIAVMDIGFIITLIAGIFYTDGMESIRKAGAAIIGTEGYKIPWVTIKYGPRIIEVCGHVDNNNVITVKTKNRTIRVYEKEAENRLIEYLSSL